MAILKFSRNIPILNIIQCAGTLSTKLYCQMRTSCTTSNTSPSLPFIFVQGVGGGLTAQIPDNHLTP